MDTLEILLPVIIILSLGFILRKTEFLSSEFTSGLGRLAYWVGLPAYLFYEISTMDKGLNEALESFAVMMCGMAAAIILAAVICFVFKIKKSYIGSFIQGSFRTNIAYIGIPVVFYTFAGYGSGMRSDIARMCILTLAMCVPAYNIISVIALLVTDTSANGRQFWKTFQKIVTNPLIISVVLGLLAAHFRVEMPVYLDRSFDAITGLVLPAALLCVGATLAQTRFSWTLLQYSLTASLIKVGFCPLIGYFAADWFGLTDTQKLAVMLLLASPTAVSSYILAEQLNGNKELSASIVVNSTVISFVSFAVILGLKL
ncbi:auxin efflux carrier [Limihaloglobus sulfuriphilus]|uniref:Auxin efflux carrier n=1 Tax=Limihaloglobus sulfuriphilus TaxID=1851148 RepID=A0A1Q2MC46_9BACT|nr:AEC family transporter [Limihaloglobus sulfuriphilus]AQQ70251.1 auxin efflux carrier [Limihaloglobus sulfuriphilus]